MTSSDVDAWNHNCSASVATASKQNLNKQKRSVKRDRHSKILTAQGVRDRRMRLSLDVASEFFGLQDLRDDDKPSKTIRWLLNQCKGAIKELVGVKEMERNKKCRDRANSGVSSTSECEVMSGIEETSNERDRERIGRNREGKIDKKQPRKTKFHTIGKESREKARARARERTIEKKRGKRSESGAEMRPKKIFSSSPSETGEESGASQSQSHQSRDMKSSMAVAVVVEEPGSHSLLDLQGPNQKTVEEHLLTTNKTSESSIFNFQHEIAITQGLIRSNTSTKDNNVPSFFENWDIDGSRPAHSCYCTMNNPYPSTGNLQERRACSSVFQTTSEIHLQCHLSDVQTFGKPWEVFNMN